MNSDKRPPRNPSAVWGEGTSWVVGDPQSADPSRDETAAADDRPKTFNRPTGSQQVPQEEQMTVPPGQQKKQAKDVFTPDQAALWEELYDWGLRVRRDILCLEAWAKRQGLDPSEAFQTCGTPGDSRQATQAVIRALAPITNGDPGDPPGGPFDYE